MMWLVFATLALLAYALWGVMNGVIANKMDPYSGIFFSGIGYLFSGAVALSLINFKLNVTFVNLAWGAVLGVATGIGGLMFLLAIKAGGNINIIVVLTSLYPLLTLLINYVLFGTAISTLQLVGVGLAIPALIMISIG